jgi:hypothetical protein
MRLLGAINEARNLRLDSSGTVEDFYADTSDFFSVLGGRCTATTGCPSLPVSHSSRFVQYHTALKALYTTALVKAWGYGWTTGRVDVRALDHAYFNTILTGSGFDMRTPLGQGRIRLVSPQIAHWDFESLPLDRTTGAIGILDIRFAPEPTACLMLAVGAGALVVLKRVSQKR